MRRSDLLLDDFGEIQRVKGEEKKQSRCFQGIGIAFLILGLLAMVGVFAYFAFPAVQANVDGDNDIHAPILRSPHQLCDTCHMNPEVDGDYVLCQSCGFEPSTDKTLKCPKGYGNMFVTKARYGPKQSAEIEGKIYTHCKGEMNNGAAECNVNVMELIPDLKEMKPEPRDHHHHHHHDGPWGDKKNNWFDGNMPPSPFWDFETFEILPFDDLPLGPNGESFEAEAMEGDAAILEALDAEPEINNIQELFLAMPHRPSLKLEKALLKCMVKETGEVVQPCAVGATKLRCKGADSADPNCVGATGPICSDGNPAACPENAYAFNKKKRCFSIDGSAAPEMPNCEVGKPKKCKKNGVKNAKCTQKKQKLFCKDGSVPICADGFRDKKAMPKCIPDDGQGPKKYEECLDGSIVLLCVDHPDSEFCVDKPIHKTFCLDGGKSDCPDGYGKGPCINDSTGARTKPLCLDETDKAVNCDKPKFAQKPFCQGKSGKVCKKSGEAATCATGSTLKTKKNNLFLSAPRPGQHHGHRHAGEEGFLLPYGPNGESLADHATPDDQPVLDALMDAQHIQNAKDLFGAIGDRPMSFKLSRALMMCMQDGDIKTMTKIQCAGDATLLGPGKCRGVARALAKGDQAKKPISPELQAACETQLANMEAGNRTPLCSDGEIATCPENFKSYSKDPRCILNQPNVESPTRVTQVCDDGSEPIDCEAKENFTHKLCGQKHGGRGKGGKPGFRRALEEIVLQKRGGRHGGKKGPKGGPRRRRFVCEHKGVKLICPENYSTGECKDQGTGVRSKANCADGKKPIKCHKMNKDPACVGKKGLICQSTGEAPECEASSVLDFSDYEVATTVPQFMLQAPRPRGPRGGPRGPHGPPHGGPKPEIEVDFLCLKVNLN